MSKKRLGAIKPPLRHFICSCSDRLIVSMASLHLAYTQRERERRREMDAGKCGHVHNGDGANPLYQTRWVG